MYYIITPKNKTCCTWSKLNVNHGIDFDISQPRFGTVICFNYDKIPFKVREHLFINNFVVFDIALIYYLFFEKYTLKQIEELADIYLKHHPIVDQFQKLKEQLSKHLKSLKALNGQVLELPDQIRICLNKFTTIQHQLIYKLFLASHVMLDDISFKFYIDYLERARKLYHNIAQTTDQSVCYTSFSTISGRVKCIGNSETNILMVNDEKRRELLKKEFYKTVFLDFKAFQPTIAFLFFARKNSQLLDYLQSGSDLYSNMATILNYQRNKIKSTIFYWLWRDFANNNKKSSLVFNQIDKLFGNDLIKFRKYLFESYQKNQGKLRTPLGRIIFPKSEEHIVFNNYIQAVESELIHIVAFELQQFLLYKKSKIQAIIYDCICIQLHKDEEDILDNLKQITIETASNYFSFKNIFYVKVS